MREMSDEEFTAVTGLDPVPDRDEAQRQIAANYRMMDDAQRAAFRANMEPALLPLLDAALVPDLSRSDSIEQWLDEA